MFFFFSSRRRHTRCGRDWSSDVCSSDLKERLVEGDVLVAFDRLTFLHIGNPVYQQKRVSVWQVLKNLINLHLHVDRPQPSDFFSSSFMRRARLSSCLKRTAFLRQFRLVSALVPEEYTPGSRISPVTSVMPVRCT